MYAHTATKIPLMYSFSGNCVATVPISTLMFSVSDLYILRIICLFCWRKIYGPILGIYKSLTDRWMWKWDLAKCGWDLAKCGWDLAKRGWDLAKSRMIFSQVRGYDLAKNGWDLAKLRMRSSQVVTASGCQFQSCNSPGFDPSILRHSGIWGAAMKQCWITYIKRKKQKIPPLECGNWDWRRAIPRKEIHELLFVAVYTYIFTDALSHLEFLFKFQCPAPSIFFNHFKILKRLWKQGTALPVS